MALDARGGPDAGALILPDARRIALDRDVVIGRAPVAPDDSPAARSVSLGTPMVSKSHALIGRSRGVVWVIDLDSSNGTEIVDPSGAATVVTPGERTPIAPGCHLRLGAVVVITVERPVDRDDDVTVEREIDASASGPPPTMIVPQPAPSSPVQPLPAQPPPPAPTAPSPSPPPFFASAPANSAPATAQQPVVPPAGSPGAHTLPAPMPTGAGVQRGRSSAHVVGALVVLVWGMVSGWRLLEIGPDVLFENLNGWPSRFFSQVSRVEFEFVEFFSVVPTPDVLSPIVYVLAATVCVLALAVPGVCEPNPPVAHRRCGRRGAVLDDRIRGRLLRRRRC